MFYTVTFSDRSKESISAFSEEEAAKIAQEIARGYGLSVIKVKKEKKY